MARSRFNDPIELRRLAKKGGPSFPQPNGGVERPFDALRQASTVHLNDIDLEMTTSVGALRQPPYVKEWTRIWSVAQQRC
jgi:hypothetical protein